MSNIQFRTLPIRTFNAHDCKSTSEDGRIKVSVDMVRRLGIVMTVFKKRKGGFEDASALARAVNSHIRKVGAYSTNDMRTVIRKLYEVNIIGWSDSVGWRLNPSGTSRFSTATFIKN